MIRKNAVTIILLLSVVLAFTIRWNGVSGENYRSIITSDGRGYYQYFVSSLGEESLGNQKYNGTYLVHTPDIKVVNKYFVGLPTLWSPFVLPVYAYYYLIDDVSVNMYAEGFQKAVSLAALVYLFLGLFALKRLLQSFDFEQKVINFSIFAFFFGTNLSYYTIIAPSMSHVYSFALISAFLFFVRQYSIKQLPNQLIYASLVFGLILLVRPVNGLVLLSVPLFWKKGSPFFWLLKSQIKSIIAAIFLVLMILVIQPIFWYLQTGSFLQWSYAGEGFYFAHPRIVDFLMSFRKGALLYTPLIFISTFGLVQLYSNSRKKFWFALSFILILFYVLSSWWNWYYGDSFGSRVMIDFYPIFILFFAYGLQYAGATVRKVLLAVSSLLIVLNIFQSYQYYHNIMSHYDMNKEKYMYIFGKFGEEYENRLGGNDDIAPYHKKPMKSILLVDKQKYSPFYRTSCAELIDADSANISTYINGQEFPCTISISAEKLMNYRALYVEMDCISRNIGEELNDVFWTISIRSEHTPSHYYAFRINGTPERKEALRYDRYRFSLPVPKHEDDELLISLWNKGKNKFNIEMLKFKVLGVTE